MDVKRDLLRRDLSRVLAEKWQSFDGITDQIERAGDLVKELGGLAQLTEFERARIGEMIETQVGLGIARGDFDFVFKRHKPRVVEVGGFSIAKLDLMPDDLVVLKVPGDLTTAVRLQVEEIGRQIFPHPRKVVVIENSIEVQILKEVKS